MIFSRFFKPQWQHKDSSVRLNAIEQQLAVDDSAQLAILKQLAETDPQLEVNRTALLKINDADYFFQQSEQHSKKAIRQFAQKQFQQWLLSSHSQQNNELIKQKLSYLPKLANAVIEAWLEQAELPEVIIALYQQLNKPFWLQRLFEQKPIAQVQAFVIEQINDINTLEKLSKKACNAEISEQLQAKIEQLQLLAQKPAQVQQTTQLVLAKLLALKDEKDYPLMQQKQQQLLAEWQSLVADFDCLPAAQQQLFHEKYQTIEAQLTRSFAEQKQCYVQQQIAEQAQQQKQQVLEQFEQQINTLQQQIQALVLDNQTLDDSELKGQINSLLQQLNDPLFNELEQQGFCQRLSQLQQQLAQLPEIAEAVGQATQLIASLAQWQMPHTLADYVALEQEQQQIQQRYRQLKRQASHALPSALSSAYQQWQGTWQHATLDFQRQLKQLFEQVKQKQADIQRLIGLGKFNACFAIHRAMTEQFEQLTPVQQAKLQVTKNQLDEKMAELADWEQYVATPKKQALLEQIAALAESPVDNPQQQAKLVQQLRKQWEQAGHSVDDEQDNNQFNALSEQAFAPCRLFYAEQQKIRENNQQKRQQLIAAMQQLAAEFKQQQTVDWKYFDTQSNQLKQAFKQVGAVDKAIYQTLTEQFKQAASPLDIAFTQYHFANAQQKQALIEQAQTTAEQSNNAIDAAQQLKQLQQQWKAVGHAGLKQESKLWQKFRAINDQVFSERDQLLQQQKSQQQQLQQTLLAKFKQLPTLNSSVTLAELQQIEQHLSEITTDSSFSHLYKTASDTINQYQTELQQLIKHKQDEQQQQLWQSIFALLEGWCLGQFNQAELTAQSDYQQLSPMWQKCMQQLVTLEQEADRASLTLSLEVLADKVPAHIDHEAKMAAQVALMQQKLDGGSTDLTEQLAQWLLLGKLDLSQKDYLHRVKSLFVRK